MIDQFWNLEATDSPKTTDDDKALHTFEKTVECVNNKILCFVAMEEANIALPENYYLALGRLKPTVSKLQRSPQLLETYGSIIREQLERGLLNSFK